MTPQIFCTATLSNILLAALQLRQHLPLTPVSNFFTLEARHGIAVHVLAGVRTMAQDKHQSRLKFNVSTFPLQTLPAQRWIFGGHFPALQKKTTQR